MQPGRKVVKILEAIVHVMTYRMPIYGDVCVKIVTLSFIVLKITQYGNV